MGRQEATIAAARRPEPPPPGAWPGRPPPSLDMATIWSRAGVVYGSGAGSHVRHRMAGNGPLTLAQSVAPSETPRTWVPRPGSGQNGRQLGPGPLDVAHGACACMRPPAPNRRTSGARRCGRGHNCRVPDRRAHIHTRRSVSFIVGPLAVKFVVGCRRRNRHKRCVPGRRRPTTPAVPAAGANTPSAAAWSTASSAGAIA